MAALEASLAGKKLSDAAPALVRLAQLRPRQRPRRAVQRRARPRPALPPAAREGRARGSRRAASAPRRTGRSRYEEIGHGYDLEDGKTVVLTDEELDAVAPRKTRTIDIEAFVELAEIDPIYFDHPYFLVPTGESEGPRRAYQLLVEVMGQQRAGRARALRAAHEGVPRRDPRARRGARAHDDALRRRGAPDRGIDDGRQEAAKAAARPGGRPDRGARDRLGPGRLRGRLPHAARGRHRPQAQGQQDHGARSREKAPRPCPT